MSGLSETDMAVLAKRLSPDKIIEAIAAALRAFHSADPALFGQASIPGESLVHGDACLPNFMCRDDGALNGYLDVGEMGLGDIEVDLAAAVWSLRYNLRADFRVRFLRAHGLPDPTPADALRLPSMDEALVA
jgi:kanamycin kinase